MCIYVCIERSLQHLLDCLALRCQSSVRCISMQCSARGVDSGTQGQCITHSAVQCQRGGLGDRGAPSLSINDRADAKKSQLHSRHKGWPLLSAIYVQCIFIFDEVWLSFVDHTSWSPQLSRRKYDQNNWLHSVWFRSSDHIKDLQSDGCNHCNSTPNKNILYINRCIHNR